MTEKSGDKISDLNQTIGKLKDKEQTRESQISEL